MIDPFVPPDRWKTLEDVQRNADRLNARAEQAARSGLKVGYHNHDHELSPTIDGTPALEVFADLLDPAVQLEVDLYWATAGGADPVALLAAPGRPGGRGPRQGRPDAARHHPPPTCRQTSSRPVRATSRWPPAPRCRDDSQYAVIEFDHYEGDVFDGIAQSYRYLSSIL